MNSSVSHGLARTPRARVARHVSDYMHRDNAGPITSWVRDPRCELAYTVSKLGAAVSRLGHRIHPDAPADYSQGLRDGEERRALIARILGH